MICEINDCQLWGGEVTCPQFSVHVRVCVCVLDEQDREQECLYAHKHYTESALCEVGMGGSGGGYDMDHLCTGH